MKAPTLPALLSSSLAGILSLIVTWGLWRAVDGSRSITVSRGQLEAWVLPIVFSLVSLAYYCWRLHSAFGLKERRSAKVQYWREQLEGAWSRDDFVDSLLYSDMRSHLKQSTRDTVEGRMRTVIRDRKGNVEKTLLIDNISAIEKHWGLI